MRSHTLCIPLTKYFSGDKLEEDVKDGAYDTYGGQKTSIKGVGGKSGRKSLLGSHRHRREGNIKRKRNVMRERGLDSSGPRWG
jgi:hypothetical protein